MITGRTSTSRDDSRTPQVLTLAMADIAPANDHTLAMLSRIQLLNAIDLTRGDADGVFAVAATDAGGDLDFVTVQLDRAFVNGDGELQDTITIRDSDDSYADGVSFGHQTFGAATAGGTYRITRVTATDDAGNLTVYDPATLAGLGIATSFGVVNPSNTGNPADAATRPFEAILDMLDSMIDQALARLIVPRVSATPVIDLSRTVDVNGAGVLTATVDGDTGLTGATLHLSRTIMTSDGPTDTIVIDADRSDGSGNVTLRLTQDNQAGAVIVTDVDFTYLAKPDQTVSREALLAAGGHTSFEITDTSLPATATVCVPAATEGADDHLALSVTLHGGAGAVSVTLVGDNAAALTGVDLLAPTIYTPYDLTGTGGEATIDLPSIRLLDDDAVDGTKTVSVLIQATGQVFSTGTDSVVVEVPIYDDELAATGGDDVLIGQSGDDRVDGLAGDDRLVGQGGRDTFWGNAGDDVLDGGDGDDVLDGGAGRDRLLPGLGADRVSGGTGNDVIVIAAQGTLPVAGLLSDRFIDGGAGRDTLDLSAYVDTGFNRFPVDLYLQPPFPAPVRGHPIFSVTNIENVIGSAGNDTVRGSDAVNVLTGGEGSDVLSGLGGDDRIDGGAGGDVLRGDAGADRLWGGAGADRFVFAAGDFGSGGHVDHIVDFSGAGGDGDRIDLSAIADFTFVGGATFGANGGSELRVGAPTAVGVSLFGDIDGDGRADFRIVVKSDQPLTAADFVRASSAAPLAPFAQPAAATHGERPDFAPAHADMLHPLGHVALV